MTRVFSPEDVDKMKDIPVRAKKGKSPRVFSAEDVGGMADAPEDAEEEESFAGKVLSGVATVGEFIDRYTGAPVRKGIGELVEGKGIGEAAEAAYEQIGEPTETAPTGKDIATEIGFSPEPVKMLHPMTGEELPGEGVSPAGAVGLGIDIFAEPVLPASIATKAITKTAMAIRPVRLAAKSRASKASFEALGKISGNSNLKEAFKKSTPEIVGKVVVEQDLARYLNRPDTLLKKIQGETKTLYKSTKGVDIAKRAREPGLIGEFSDHTSKIVDQISDKIPKMDRSILADDLIGKYHDKILTHGGEFYSVGEADKYAKKVQELLKIKDWKVGDPANMMSVKEMHERYREIGAKLRSRDMFQPTSTKLAREKQVLMDTWFTLREAIESAADFAGDQMGQTVKVRGGQEIGVADAVRWNNQAVSSMMDIETLLENIPAAQLKQRGAVERVIDLAIGGMMAGGAAMAGYPGAGLGLAGAYELFREGRAISRAWPGFKARMMTKPVLGEGILPSTPGYKAVQRSIDPMRTVGLHEEELQDFVHSRGEYHQGKHRKPQSMVEDLIRTPIPRDTDAILENVDFVRAKLAQQAPEAFDMFNEVVEHRPHHLKEILPFLIEQAPQLFHPDQYDRVDGKVTTPLGRERATVDTMKRDDLTETEKILKINHLNKTREFSE